MMQATENKPFVVAVSSSALFDTRTEEVILRESRLPGFLAHRKKFEGQVLEKGTAFSFIEGLLRLNSIVGDKPVVDVVIASKNNPDVCLCVTNSIRHYGLDISRFAFTSGEPVVGYLREFEVSLFLSRDQSDVSHAIASGIGAARVYDPPAHVLCADDQLRIAFDGDAVIFSDEAEKVYQEAKKHAPKTALSVFHAHEKSKALIPLPPGPLAPFFKIISELQSHPGLINEKALPAIRTALITARNFPAHERALRTLKSWGVEVNVAIFLGGKPKAGFVREFNPQIFFDDQDQHLKTTSSSVPSAMVPCEVTSVSPRVIVQTTVAEVARVNETPALKVRQSDVNVDVGISKADFEKRCRSVFQSYTPLKEGGRPLAKQYRDFIDEGLRKDSGERSRLASELEKYSLASMSTHDPMLNREGATLLEKLKEIERGSEGENLDNISLNLG